MSRSKYCYTGSPDNIIEIVKSATNKQRASGLAWYDEDRLFAAGLADDYGYDVELIAAVISALSQANGWSNNKRATFKVVSNHAAGKKNWWQWNAWIKNAVKKAFYILENGSTEIATPKTRDFAKVIADPNNPYTVVVDRWAYRAWVDDINNASSQQVSDKNYERIAVDYRIAAHELGLLPSQCQAIAWVVIRDKILGSRVAAYD